MEALTDASCSGVAAAASKGSSSGNVCRICSLPYPVAPPHCDIRPVGFWIIAATFLAKAVVAADTARNSGNAALTRHFTPLRDQFEAALAAAAPTTTKSPHGTASQPSPPTTTTARSTQASFVALAVATARVMHFYMKAWKGLASQHGRVVGAVRRRRNMEDQRVEEAAKAAAATDGLRGKAAEPATTNAQVEGPATQDSVPEGGPPAGGAAAAAASPMDEQDERDEEYRCWEDLLSGAAAMSPSAAPIPPNPCGYTDDFLVRALLLQPLGTLRPLLCPNGVSTTTGRPLPPQYSPALWEGAAVPFADCLLKVVSNLLHVVTTAAQIQLPTVCTATSSTVCRRQERPVTLLSAALVRDVWRTGAEATDDGADSKLLGGNAAASSLDVVFLWEAIQDAADVEARRAQTGGWSTSPGDEEEDDDYGYGTKSATVSPFRYDPTTILETFARRAARCFDLLADQLLTHSGEIREDSPADIASPSTPSPALHPTAPSPPPPAWRPHLAGPALLSPAITLRALVRHWKLLVLLGDHETTAEVIQAVGALLRAAADSPQSASGDRDRVAHPNSATTGFQRSRHGGGAMRLSRWLLVFQPPSPVQAAIAPADVAFLQELVTWARGEEALQKAAAGKAGVWRPY